MSVTTIWLHHLNSNNNNKKKQTKKKRGEKPKKQGKKKKKKKKRIEITQYYFKHILEAAQIKQQIYSHLCSILQTNHVRYTQHHW